MSRIGKEIVYIPESVKVTFQGQRIIVDGPQGFICKTLPVLVRFNYCIFTLYGAKMLLITKRHDTKLSQAIYGLFRTLVANMIDGVSVGFQKKLQIKGVGYKAQLDGKDLVLNMGYSHTVKMAVPSGLVVKVENPTTIVVSGAEKDMVGEFAAKIRSVRPPEPYKGKGITYEGEIIRRKAGKTRKGR
jgi:large subunit ribosomal protein L6